MSDRDAAFDFEGLKAILLETAVRTLRICTLYFRQDRSAEEIAVMMGMTESAVRSVIKRARRKLAHRERGENAPV